MTAGFPAQKKKLCAFSGLCPFEQSQTLLDDIAAVRDFIHCSDKYVFTPFFYLHHGIQQSAFKTQSTVNVGHVIGVYLTEQCDLCTNRVEGGLNKGSRVQHPFFIVYQCVQKLFRIAQTA